MANSEFLASLTPEPVEVLAAMDPGLQLHVARSQQVAGAFDIPTQAPPDIPVIAKVTDHRLWAALDGVRPGTVIPAGSGFDGDIVTGRIAVSAIETIRRDPCVKSVKAARRIRAKLDHTIPSIGADRLAPENRAAGGAGVVVGIVDFGCDFAHQNFRNEDGSTRLLAIWHQAAPPDPTGPFGVGKVYGTEDIDAALKDADPYVALGYGPPPDNPGGDPGAHGTHVMDIASGNGRGTGLKGVAPSAAIVFVELSTSDVPAGDVSTAGKCLGDSVHLLEAVQFIFDQAGARPCVINLSIGGNGGPHDGSSLVEEGIDRLLLAQPNRAVVIAAANAFADAAHVQGSPQTGGHVDVTCSIGAESTAGEQLEIWYPGADRLALELITPAGNSVVRVEPGETRKVTSAGNIAALVANRLNDPNNHDNNIVVFLELNLSDGDWIARLHGASVQQGSYHAWIEGGPGGESCFGDPDCSHTIGSIACGRETIVVGAYDFQTPTAPCPFSSAGPTRDGRQKPDISAPGNSVQAAHSRTGNQAVRKSGTSQAAPAITGIVALMFAEAAAAGLSLTSAQVRDILTRTSSGFKAAWHSQLGFGQVSAGAAVAAASVVRQTGAAP